MRRPRRQRLAETSLARRRRRRQLQRPAEIFLALRRQQRPQQLVAYSALRRRLRRLQPREVSLAPLVPRQRLVCSVVVRLRPRLQQEHCLAVERRRRMRLSRRHLSSEIWELLALPERSLERMPQSQLPRRLQRFSATKHRQPRQRRPRQPAVYSVLLPRQHRQLEVPSVLPRHLPLQPAVCSARPRRSHHLKRLLPVCSAMQNRLQASLVPPLRTNQPRRSRRLHYSLLPHHKHPQFPPWLLLPQQPQVTLLPCSESLLQRTLHRRRLQPPRLMPLPRLYSVDLEVRQVNQLLRTLHLRPQHPYSLTLDRLPQGTFINKLEDPSPC